MGLFKVFSYLPLELYFQKVEALSKISIASFIKVVKFLTTDHFNIHEKKQLKH